jgi:hypothetical protein
MTTGTARAAAWLYAAVVVAVLAHFLYGLPIQMSDSYGNMLKLDLSWTELMVAEFTQQAYLRPFLWGAMKAVYDASDGNYFAWFRGTHVAQVAVLVALYVHLVRPRTWGDAAALPIGLAALIGIHTFAGTIREAFPVNTFLTMMICCFAAAAIALGRYHWWNDLLVPLIFAAASLTVESGLLVGVVVIAAALVGGRGVSRIGQGLVLLLGAGYFILRFAVLEVGSPDLLERSSGYGFGVLDPPDLVARFGDNPLTFYVYNVVTSFLSVLFAEPRAGVFRFVRELTYDVNPGNVITVAATTLMTFVILWHAWGRRRAWMARTVDHGDRLVLMFPLVLAANALISYPYTKDVIMSPAGGFYALAAYVAVRHLIATERVRAMSVAWQRAAVAACCAALGTTWAIRHVSVHALLNVDALRVRNEWVYVEGWLEQQNYRLDDPRDRALLKTLQDDALIKHPMPPAFAPASRLYDVD